MGTGPHEGPLTFWGTFQKVHRSHIDFPSDQEDMSDDHYPRYDTTMARLARDDCEVFNHEDNREDHVRAEFFASFLVDGICKYPPPVSYREYSALSKRLRRLIQNRAALVESTNVALALIKAMKAYPMSSQKWSEYKEFVRREGTRANAARAQEAARLGVNTPRPVHLHMGCVPVFPLTDETANEYAAVWVLKLHKKTTATLRACRRPRKFCACASIGAATSLLRRSELGQWLPMILIGTPVTGVRHLPPLRALHASLQRLLDTSRLHAGRVLTLAVLGRSNDVRVPAIVLVLAVVALARTIVDRVRIKAILLGTTESMTTGLRLTRQDLQPAMAVDFAVLRSEVADCAAKLSSLHALVEKVATSVAKVVSAQAPVAAPSVVTPAHVDVSTQSDESLVVDPQQPMQAVTELAVSSA
ncbi:hypothetical protein AC1031_008618 [Aphanomyces cochlioides]|nr:hypothetical protein AC1031_008618 [Aphanomyces cochlioides]